MKYKVTERFSMGWTDPRGIFGSSTAPVELALKHQIVAELAEPFEHTDTSILRNLWLARWGHHAVNVDDVRIAMDAKEPVLGAMRALSDRKLVRYEKVTDLRRNEEEYYYTLEREDGDR